MFNDTDNNVGELNPLVSVIIPSYNHADFVRESILSVVNQSYQNIELIVIDDGSKDDSIAVILALKEDYNFEVVTRENRGLSFTLNEGINLASGKYICILASDDYYLSSRVKSAVSVLEESDERVFAVYCDGYIVDKSGQKLGLFSDKYVRPLVGGTYNNLIAGNWLPAMGMTYKRSVLTRFMFDPKYKIEDHSLYLKMFAEKNAKLLAISTYGFAYRLHGDNFSEDLDIMKAQHELIVDHFPEMKSYQYFIQSIRTFGRLHRESISIRNITILFLVLIRKLQQRLLFRNY